MISHNRASMEDLTKLMEEISQIKDKKTAPEEQEKAEKERKERKERKEKQEQALADSSIGVLTEKFFCIQENLNRMHSLHRQALEFLSDKGDFFEDVFRVIDYSRNSEDAFSMLESSLLKLNQATYNKKRHLGFDLMLDRAMTRVEKIVVEDLDFSLAPVLAEALRQKRGAFVPSKDLQTALQKARKDAKENPRQAPWFRYELCLMSELPADQMPEKQKIYIDTEGSYIVLDPKGDIANGNICSLQEAIPSLKSDLNKPNFKEKVLQCTLTAGHTLSLEQHKLLQEVEQEWNQSMPHQEMVQKNMIWGKALLKQQAVYNQAHGFIKAIKKFLGEVREISFLFGPDSRMPAAVAIGSFLHKYLSNNSGSQLPSPFSYNPSPSPTVSEKMMDRSFSPILVIEESSKTTQDSATTREEAMEVELFSYWDRDRVYTPGEREQRDMKRLKPNVESFSASSAMEEETEERCFNRLG